jgi:hypothetical protein
VGEGGVGFLFAFLRRHLDPKVRLHSRVFFVLFLWVSLPMLMGSSCGFALGFMFSWRGEEEENVEGGGPGVYVVASVLSFFCRILHWHGCCVIVDCLCAYITLLLASSPLSTTTHLDLRGL